MAVGDIYRVTIRGKFDEQDVINVYHWYQSVQGVPDMTPLGLAAEMENRWRVNMLPQLSASYSLVGVDCQRLRPILSAIFTSPTDPAEPGQLVGDALPGTVATVITLRTDMGGKARRGRTYICAPPENVTTLGRILAAYRTDLSTAFTAFRASYSDVAGNTSYMVIYSTRSTTVPAHTVTPVTDHIVQSVMGNMRSRRIGRGS